jgi:hypothetical protein
MHDHSRTPRWRGSGGIALIGIGSVVAFYVLREHYAPALGMLPHLLLLACPVMHLFMHRGHGGDQSPFESLGQGARRRTGPSAACRSLRTWSNQVWQE